MARFAVGQPIKTREPLVEVDAGLEPGVHLFQLEVVDGDGNVSRPDVASVTVKERADPNDRVLEPVDTDRITRNGRITRIDDPLRPG